MQTSLPRSGPSVYDTLYACKSNTSHHSRKKLTEEVFRIAMVASNCIITQSDCYSFAAKNSVLCNFDFPRSSPGVDLMTISFRIAQGMRCLTPVTPQHSQTIPTRGKRRQRWGYPCGHQATDGFSKSTNCCAGANVGPNEGQQPKHCEDTCGGCCQSPGGLRARNHLQQ